MCHPSIIFDALLNAGPYLTNKNGTGNNTAATAPIIEIAGPIPNALIIGFAANGNPAAMILLRNVTAAVELAAYTRYTSIRKFKHCWKIQLNPAPIQNAAKHGKIQ